MLLFLFNIVLAAKVHVHIDPRDLKNKFLYVSKFGVNVPDGSMQISTRFINPSGGTDGPVIQVLTYIDDQWWMQQLELTCDNKARAANFMDRMSIRNDGTQQTHMRELYQRNRDHIWFIAVADCDGVLENTKTKIELEIVWFNNGSHLSCEHNFMHLLYFIQIVISIVFILYSLRNMKDDQFLQGIVYVLFIDLVAEVFLYLHYQLFVYNGTGFALFEFLGNQLTFCAGFILSGLFILFSKGWTIIHSDFNYQSELPYGLIVVGIQMISYLITKVSDDDSKYHNFTGLGGILLMIMKVGILAYFIYNLQKLNKFKGFVNIICLIGSLYLISYPVLICIAEVFVTDYWKFRVITIGNIIIRHLTIVYLVYICTSKKSSYFEIKNKSQTII